MAVCIVDKRGETQKESCSLTDINGVRWCFKAITNVRRAGFDKAFVCCGPRCNCKLFYSSPTDFLIEGVHCCLFDHEREFRKRERLRLAIAAMEEDCTRRPCEIVRIVKKDVPLSSREEASLTQFILRKNVTHAKQFPKNIADFVIPDELKHIIARNVDVGDTLFLLHDSSMEEPNQDRFLIFSSFSMRQRARLAREVFADGTYRSVSNIFATLYTLHTVINNISYPIFFVLTSNEQKLTFIRIFTYIKTYMTQFDTSCVVHVDCQLAAINAFSDVFNCRIQLCLFHQNQAVWRAVSKFGLASPYNSKTNVKLHIWIRRLLSLPFLPPEMIRGNFEILFERDAIVGSFHVEDEFIEPFKRLISYYKRYWILQIPIEMWCQHSNGERTNNRCEGFHNKLRQVVSIVHPNPFMTIQFLRRIDLESTNAFEMYLNGDDVKRMRRRTEELENKICDIIERFNANRDVFPPRQFLDSISLVYLEYYYHEKMARRNVSLKLLSLSKEQLESIVAVMNEQNNYDQLDGTTNEAEYVDRNNETELFYDSLIDSTIGIIADHDEQTISSVGQDNEACIIVNDDEPGICRQKRRTSRAQKRQVEKKPRRRKETLLKRLEKARAKARRSRGD